MSMSHPEVVIEVTKRRSALRSRQQYRFKITRTGNHKCLAVSNDAYANEGDCLSAAYMVTGYDMTEIPARVVIHKHYRSQIKY